MLTTKTKLNLVIMNKNYLNLFVFTLLLFISAGSLNAQRTCGSQELLEMQNQDPKVKAERDAINQFIKDYLKANPPADGEKANVVITIPTVFHIVHNGDAVGSNENITDAQCIAQLDQLNLDYRASNPDVSNVPAEFSGDVADVEVEFCLASVDPSGNATTGIIRHDLGTASWSMGAFDGTAKPATVWDRDLYLNFWTANLSGGLLGYAQFPGGGASTDGVVCLYNTVGSVASPAPGGAPYDRGRTGTHEVGHWLGLYHIWGDDGGGCTGSDSCNDTPNQGDSYGGSPAHPQSSCGSNDMFMNYMDYVNDLAMYMFTNDQKARVVATLNGSRSSLLTSAATRCTAPVPTIQFGATDAAIPEESGCNDDQTTWTLDVNLSGTSTVVNNVALTLTGTADAQDYTVTPASLSFPAGSTTPQEITITLREDAVVEPDETLIITLGTPSGDAVLGANDVFTITILNDDAAPVSSGGATTTLWTEDWEAAISGWFIAGTTNASQNEFGIFDFSPCSPNNLFGASTVAAIYDNDNGTSYCDYWNYGYASESILLKEVNATGLGNIQVTFDYAVGGNANDYGDFIYSTDGGTTWTTIGGPYTGQATPATVTVTMPASLDDSTFDIGWRWTDNGDGTTNQPGLQFDNITVTGTGLVNEIETIVTPTATDYDEQYLGPFETVHYFNPTTGTIMCTIENLTGHDYGCTKVEVDRAGTTSFLSNDFAVVADITDKNFLVTPEVNNPGGGYNMTLYYTEAEIAGWEASNTATHPRTDLLMIKSVGSISAAATYETAGTAPVAYNTTTPVSGWAYTSTFGTGFSGFALGDGPGGLDVQLVYFDGKATPSGSLLEWQTSSETNSDFFTLEKSVDGEFEFLAKIQGAGTTSEKQSYEYLDPNPQIGENYYRLSQTDFDGRTEYFNVVTVNYNGDETVTVSPNPVADEIFVTYTSVTNGNMSLDIFSADGKLVKSINTSVAKGENNYTYNVSELAGGVYYMKINNGIETTSMKFIKM